MTLGKDLFDPQNCPGQFPLVSLPSSVLITCPHWTHSQLTSTALCVCVLEGQTLEGQMDLSADTGRSKQGPSGHLEHEDRSLSPNYVAHMYLKQGLTSLSLLLICW